MQDEDEIVSKEEGSIEILIILGLIETTYLFLKYGWKNISQGYRLKNIDETRNYFLE